MAVQFEFYENPSKADEGKKKKGIHARVVSRETITTEQLVREIHGRSSLGIGEVESVLSYLSQKMSEHLRDGDRVHLEGIGYFQLTLACEKPLVSPKMTARNVKFKSVKFRADQKLKNQVSWAKIERSKVRAHSESLSAIEIERVLTGYFAEHEVLTRVKLQQLCGMTSSTAYRHLTRLKKEGKLNNIGTLRHPIYVPVPGNFRISKDKK
ncbi:DNA-binding protein [Bacteroides sp. 214]|uniref:HU family DNA-binding protein n=1 Tax=Bacteroides sp. 214 TaxID=2302935 RepID=UPI0013D88EC6|nr:HU family DNA-binding protein [Bacteroides sp. 214]NDW12226.1 DNA-binding protein [Bacteroides sp. 214]